MVPGPVYSTDESVTRRQEAIQELEQMWWNQWVVQALPHLVPYRRWKTEHRSLRINDIVLVLYEKKVSKGTYKLGRIIDVHPDAHGRVRTVTVGMRGKDASSDATYVPKALEKHRLGIQRIAVICPAEDQDLDAEDTNKQDLAASRQDLVAEDCSVTEDLDAEDRDTNREDLDAEDQVLDMDSEDLVAEERTL